MKILIITDSHEAGVSTPVEEFLFRKEGIPEVVDSTQILEVKKGESLKY